MSEFIFLSWFNSGCSLVFGLCVMNSESTLGLRDSFVIKKHKFQHTKKEKKESY